jgi:hypothetical protein
MYTFNVSPSMFWLHDELITLQRTKEKKENHNVVG